VKIPLGCESYTANAGSNSELVEATFSHGGIKNPRNIAFVGLTFSASDDQRESRGGMY
jgi:hypothetical protein